MIIKRAMNGEAFLLMSSSVRGDIAVRFARKQKITPNH
jgi:hypothetical protein